MKHISKRVLSLLLVAAMLCGLLLTTAFAESSGADVWDGSSAEIWTKGSGTAGDPFLIESAANLAYLSKLISDTSITLPEGITYRHCGGVYFKLTADLDLGLQTWTPIGTSSWNFMGSFDGDGHTIKGLSTTTGSSYQGLFGYISAFNSTPVTIKNLIVQGAVTGNQHVAGIAAYAKGPAVFENVGNEASVTATSYSVGGIVGDTGTGAFTFTNCYNKGDITGVGSSYMQAGAGLVGYYSGTSITLTNCYNLGTVNMGGGAAGGLICATSGKAITFDNCYSGMKADVTSTLTYSGALTGYIGSATGTAYYYASTKPSSGKVFGVASEPANVATAYTDYAGLLSKLGSTSFKSGEGINEDGAPALAWETAKVTAPAEYRVTFNVDTAANAQVALTNDGLALENGSIVVEENTELTFTVTAMPGYEIDSVKASGSELEAKGGTYTITVTGDMAVAIATKVSDNYFDGSGSGTSGDPYQITNEAELRQLAERVNNGVTYQGVYFQLTADITLNGEWTPIGTGNYITSDKAFKGVFDGGSHTVSGLSITRNDDTVAVGMNGYGLFGLTSGAVIKNLAVSGKIENISDAGSPTGTGANTNNVDKGLSSYFGGIVGASRDGLTLENCASHVEVTNQYYRAATTMESKSAATSYVGGLVGYSYGNLTVTNCYSDGAVTNKNTNDTYAHDTKNYVGGMVGGVYNYGGVSTITNSFAYGTVTCSASADEWKGAIIADIGGGTLTAKGCYYRIGIAEADATSSSGISSERFLTLSADLNTAAGKSLFTAGVKGHPVFSWETASAGDPPAPSAVADTTWYSDTKDSFALSTAAELLGFASLVNGGNTFEDKTVTLAADIEVPDDVTWTPIGTDRSPFSGTFNGQYYSVTLHVNNGATKDYNALFGYVTDALVEKTIVKGSVAGGNYTAGLIGNARSSSVQYCGNEAAVSGVGTVGGLVAHAYNTAILACYNRANVTNKIGASIYHTGGIVGNMTYNGSVQYCYNTGVITGAQPGDNYTYTGGIAGLSADSSLMNSYSVGTVTGGKYTGGIIGSGNLYYQQDAFSYYLEGSAAAGAGVDVDSPTYIQSATATQLKDASGAVLANLGSPFEVPNNADNSGYPVLKWENDPDYVIPYINQIYTAADLREFANNVRGGHSYVNETVTLMGDIDLQGRFESTVDFENIWTTIGSMSGGKIDYAFAGTFDGNGYTISNMVIGNSNSGYQGMFSILPEDAVVKNLTVTGKICLTGCNVGSIVGWNFGTVENCVSEVDIDVYNCSYVGGIVGDNTGTVKNCVNNGTVNGCAGSTSYYTPSNYVGGIVGHSEPAYDYGIKTVPAIENCVNNGAVTGDEYVGGIAGGAWNDAGACVSLLNCANHGDVTGYSYVGGVIGYMSAASDNYAGIAITNCYNTGDVACIGVVDYDTPYAGGIVGQAQLGELTISNCYNTGAVSGPAETNEYGGTYVGAIAGHSKAVILNTYYQLPGITENLLSVGDDTGDNYARPVSEGYLETAEFAGLLGNAYATGSNGPVLTIESNG